MGSGNGLMATTHHLDQSWPTSTTPYIVNKPQYVNGLLFFMSWHGFDPHNIKSIIQIMILAWHDDVEPQII